MPIHCVFQLEGLDVRFSVEAEDKIKEECCPGKPFASFRKEVSILLSPYHFQTRNGCHFAENIFKCIEWELFYCDSNVPEVWSWGSNWQYVIPGSGNGLSPVRRQAIIWTNDDSIQWYISAFAEFLCKAHVLCYVYSHQWSCALWTVNPAAATSRWTSPSSRVTQQSRCLHGYWGRLEETKVWFIFL